MMNLDGMKKIAGRTLVRTAAVLLCGAALVVVSAQAQDEAPPAPPAGQMQGPPPGGGGGRGMRMDPDKMVERLTKALNLTPDQATQMKGIYEGQRKKMEALRDNSAMSREDRRAQMMAIHEDGESKIKAILTPDQQTKYAEVQAKMRERMENGRRGGGGEGAAPPPPPPPPPGL
jgi:protein CpxP